MYIYTIGIASQMGRKKHRESWKRNLGDSAHENVGVTKKSTTQDEEQFDVNDMESSINRVSSAKDKENKKSSKSTLGKLQSLGSKMFASIFIFINDLLVFFISIVTVLYLLFLNKDKNIESHFPSDPTKYPYVFYDNDKDDGLQSFVTTTNIDTTHKTGDPVFKKVSRSDTTNQPSNASSSNLNSVAVFFNERCGDATQDDINILEFVSFITLFGIQWVYFVFSRVITVFGSKLNVLSSNSDQFATDVSSANVFLSTLKGIIVFFMITLVYILFKNSEGDAKGIIYRFVHGISSKSKSETDEMSGFLWIIQLFSSLLSGFVASFKIVYVISYFVFLFSILFGVFLIKNHVTLSTSILIAICVLIVLALASLNIQMLLNVLSKQDSTSVLNTLFYNIFHTVSASFGMFYKYMDNIKRVLVDNLGGISKQKSLVDMIYFVMVFIIFVGIIPLLVIPFLLLCIGLLLSLIPVTGALYTTASIAYKLTISGMFNFTSLYKEYSSVFISLALAFVLLLGLKSDFTSNNLIERFTRSGLIILIYAIMLYFGYRANKNNTQEDKYNLAILYVLLFSIPTTFIILSNIY